MVLPIGRHSAVSRTMNWSSSSNQVEPACGLATTATSPG
jgi:hypothetical protein